MKKIIKNYKMTIILLAAIVIGAIIGLIFKEKATILSPFGDLFLNLLLTIIIPLIFLTISTSIGKMKQPKRIGKILITIIIVFIITSLISASIGIVSTKAYKLVNIDSNKIIVNNETINNEEVNYLQKTINMISVNDFSKLLTRDNMIALIVFSIIFGISINITKDKSKKLLDILESTNEVIHSFLKIIMYYAPFGLGCYFASMVGTFGKEIAYGYGKTFIIYTIVCLFVYFIVYSLYAYISHGKKGLTSYWKNIIPSSITAISTCSSAASIPINTECTKKIGVPDDIANTTIPLGTNFHKDGSIIGSVFKIMFLVYLFNINISIPSLIGISLLATLLITAVPIGGGTISEALIITMLGLNPSLIGILTIIATIIDPGATLLNVVGDSASSMLITRIIDGKNWLEKKK